MRFECLLLNTAEFKAFGEIFQDLHQFLFSPADILDHGKKFPEGKFK